MELSASILSALELPFPGLRAFETEESLLFFGREVHTEELLLRLAESRFLAVVGSSGCGKSSLVRAGLLPALFRGYLVGATSRWRFAILRPGMAPIDALAAALAKDGALGSRNAKALRETLGATSGGLTEVVRGAGLAPGESLLVVVDQFEEIFRFALHGQHGGAESQVPLFVSLLLHAVESNVPVYVTLTMRSDYQGDCAQFPGLPEALNRSQYLVPRLTRDQRREAIMRPLELVGTEATPRLVNRLLNDAGDDPDQLPVLQHALLQTYRDWQKAGARGDVDLPSYEAVGGITHALGKHGDEILNGLSEGDKRLAEKIFRSLTTTERGRVVRRPQELGALHAVVNATDDLARSRVNTIISTFARREHSLLLLSSPVLEPGTVVDITHESLMRKWPVLADWIKEETRSAEWYTDLARDVVRHRTGDAGLWTDPELSEVRKRRDREGWNEAWARQCSRPGDPSFDEAGKFLDASVEAQTKQRRRERVLQRRTSILLSLLLVTVVAAVVVVYFLNRKKERQIEDLSKRYVALEEAQGEAKREAAQAKARLSAALVEYQNAKENAAEQDRIYQEIERLRRSAQESQSKVVNYESQLGDLRQSNVLASSNQSTLLKNIQELQAQLTAATAQRDRLQVQLAAARKEQDPTLLRRIDELQAQLNTVNAERDRLHLALSERTLVRPTFVVLPQYSVVHLSAAPFGGRVAVGVRAIHDDPASHVRVYIWTADGNGSLPPAFRDDEKRVDRLLKSIDQPEKECKVDGPEGRSCYRVQKGATLYGRQSAGSFTFGGARYEVFATGWNSNPDSISLALYPAP